MTSIATRVDSVDGTTNHAFMFIKPHAVTPAVHALTLRHLRAHGVYAVATGSLSAADIDRRGIVRGLLFASIYLFTPTSSINHPTNAALREETPTYVESNPRPPCIPNVCASQIDKHYGALAQRAMSVAPADLQAHGLDLNANVLAKFRARFGLTWAAALANGALVNLAGARARLPPGTPAREIERMWRAAACVKLAPGTYVAELVGAPCERRTIVVNGFYGAMRDKFTSTALAPSGVRWLRVAWDMHKLTWASFREDVVGATDPAKAAPASLRGKLMACWQALGLPAAPHGADNGVHASASPIEALHVLCFGAMAVTRISH